MLLWLDLCATVWQLRERCQLEQHMCWHGVCAYGAYKRVEINVCGHVWCRYVEGDEGTFEAIVMFRSKDWVTRKSSTGVKWIFKTEASR